MDLTQGRLLLASGGTPNARPNRVPTTRGTCVRKYLIPIFVVTALALAGCNQSKSPEDVSKDVTKAEQKAINEVTKSEEHAQSALDKSYEKVNDQEIKFNNDAAHQTYNVAIAKADGNRKVALANCEAQSGDAQKACKDQAEVDYKTARSDAKAGAVAAMEQKK
jgi:hypothetical protein